MIAANLFLYHTFFSSDELFKNDILPNVEKLQHASNDDEHISNNVKLSKHDEHIDYIREVAELPASSTEFIPIKNFDDYLLSTYGLQGESKHPSEDNFKPSKKEPELVQMIVMPKKWANSTTFSDNNDAFGVPVTPLPNFSINHFNKNENTQKQQRKNKKPFIAVSYHSNIQSHPFDKRPTVPKKSLGYQAAKMAEKYRNKRRNKKKRKIRKKLPRPQGNRNVQHQTFKSLPPNVAKYEPPSKRNIGVAIGITSNGVQDSQTFAQNPAEDFYYKLPTYNGVHELNQHEYDHGHTVTYSSSSYHQLPPVSDHGDYHQLSPISDHGGIENAVTSEEEILSYHKPINPYDPKDNALLLLGPNGPRMPILNRLVSDMSNMVSANMDPTKVSLSSKLGNSMYDNGMYVMNKIAGGTVDGEMDIFDFLPILGVIIGASLLIAGLFPTALTSFGLNNGQIVIGRRLDEKKGRADDDDTMFGVTLNHLEAGMMLMNAIRLEDDSCTEKLACRMSETLQRYTDNPIPNHWMLNALNHFAPESFQSSKFSKSFRMVLENNDNSSCNKDCYRCVAL